MSRIGERTSWIVGAAVVFAVLLVGRIDRVHTENRIPPAPTRASDFLPRYHEMQRLDREFDRRAWLYGGIAAVAMALAAAAALARSSSVAAQRRVFGQAGVAGVLLGLAGAVGLLFSRDSIDPPAGAVFLPCITLVGLAGIGGLATRLQLAPAGHAGGTGAEESPPRRPLLRVAVAALLCTWATVSLAVLFASSYDVTCGMPSTAPAWTAPVAWAAVMTAIAAGVLALVGLTARRWFVALLCFVVNPAALLLLLLSTGAACG